MTEAMCPRLGMELTEGRKEERKEREKEGKEKKERGRK